MIKKIALFLLSFSGFAQSYEMTCSNVPYFSFETTNFKTYIYSPVFVAKKAYTNLTEVSNLYPEQLIESEMSVTSQEWSSFNYGKPREAEPKRYVIIQKGDVSKNYAHLLYKVEYEFNGESYAIIKLHIYSESKKEPTGFALSMKKLENRWIVYNESSITDLMFLIVFLKAETLEAIFSQQKTGSLVLDNLRELSMVNGVFSLNKFLYSVKSTLEKDKDSLEIVLDPYRIFK